MIETPLGRKPLPAGEKLSARFTVVMKTDELERVRRVAANCGMTTSDYVRQVVVKATVEAEPISDEALAQVEEQQTSWRNRMGL